MNQAIERLIRRIRRSGREVPGLDSLFSLPKPWDGAHERIQWLIQLMAWIRGGENPTESPFHPGVLHQRSARLRFFLDAVDRDPGLKDGVAALLRAVLRETRAVDLFCETGLPHQSGLIHEITERLARRWLPQSPDAADLAALFGRLFPCEHDADWIDSLDALTLQRLAQLVQHGSEGESQDWNPFRTELDDAILYLVARIHVVGSSQLVRAHLNVRRPQQLPFCQLEPVLRDAFGHREVQQLDEMLAVLGQIGLLADGCHRCVEEILGHLEDHGVSTELVYQLMYLEKALARFGVLMELAFDPKPSVTRFGAFVATLVRENQERQHFRYLARRTFLLLTRRLVERNAQTGEHYIARTRGEYWQLLRAAAGGGVVMGVTGILKTMLFKLHWSGMVQGLAASMNYAVGFVAIQLSGFTLATKQPAATAPALASRLRRIRDPEAMAELVDEILALIRSQFVSVVGNLALVVPSIALLMLIYRMVVGVPVMDGPKALATLDSLSVVGWSGPYAAFTGLLLFFSSALGAWIDNAVAYHQLAKAYGADRHWVAWLGPLGARRLAGFLQRHIGGFTSNVSLAFLLGMIPEFVHFTGIALDVRHVTLSSALLTESLGTLGLEALWSSGGLLAVAGIALIGILNVMVSFSLALWVAIRAKGVRSTERRRIWEAMAARLSKEPLSLFYPPHRAAELDETELHPERCAK